MEFKKRSIYQPEHDLLRDELTRFLQTEVIPKLDDWESQGHADRGIWNKLGQLGAMSCMVEEKYGGTGSDMIAAAVIYEEIGRCGVAGLGGIGVHDIVSYYLQNNATEALKEKWLPLASTGEALFGVAMTEPAAGSDLRGVKTTAELFFENVRVPASNVIGEENRGLNLLMQELPFERLLIGLVALGGAKGAYAETVKYVQDRKAFGQSVASFQNTRYKLAELQTEIEVGEAFTDRCVAAHAQGELTTEQASMCKLWLTEMQDRVIDACLQLHGGYGYMWEYPIAKFYADSRVQRIYGGTSEIMKELISRSPSLDS